MKGLTYEEARREARKLLGDIAELKRNDVPVYRCVIGVIRNRLFHPLAAGMNWAEAVKELRDRVEKAKS